MRLEPLLGLQKMGGIKKYIRRTELEKPVALGRFGDERGRQLECF